MIDLVLSVTNNWLVFFKSFFFFFGGVVLGIKLRALDLLDKEALYY